MAYRKKRSFSRRRRKTYAKRPVRGIKIGYRM